MTKKIKGIYLMTCSLGPVNKSKHSQLMRQALLDLSESNIHFQKVNAQACVDRPRFYEGFQQIGYLDQPFSAIVEKQWLKLY